MPRPEIFRRGASVIAHPRRWRQPRCLFRYFIRKLLISGKTNSRPSVIFLKAIQNTAVTGFEGCLHLARSKSIWLARRRSSVFAAPNLAPMSEAFCEAGDGLYVPSCLLG